MHLQVGTVRVHGCCTVHVRVRLYVPVFTRYQGTQYLLYVSLLYTTDTPKYPDQSVSIRMESPARFARLLINRITPANRAGEKLVRKVKACKSGSEKS